MIALKRNGIRDSIVLRCIQFSYTVPKNSLKDKETSVL